MTAAPQPGAAGFLARYQGLKDHLPGARLPWLAALRADAAAHVAAMEKPEAAGQRFIVADAFLWFSDIGRILGEAFPVHRRRMPKGELPNLVSRLMVPFRLDVRAVRGDLGRVWEVTNDRAKRVLGITIRPAREAVVAMADALIRFGRVR